MPDGEIEVVVVSVVIPRHLSIVAGERCIVFDLVRNVEHIKIEVGAGLVWGATEVRATQGKRVGSTSSRGVKTLQEPSVTVARRNRDHDAMFTMLKALRKPC